MSEPEQSNPPALEAEQIGPLNFQPNPDYPYPFAVEIPPRFWMEETTGALAEAVEVYLRTEPMNPAQLTLFKLYLGQYIERAVMTGDAKRHLLLQRMEKLRKPGEIESFVEELAEFGIEPF